MKKIVLSEIYNYMDNFVDFEKAKKLDSITIARCICFSVTEIEGHHSYFHCHCFKCCTCRVLLNDLVGRKKYQLLLLINISNYNDISEDAIYENRSM